MTVNSSSKPSCFWDLLASCITACANEPESPRDRSPSQVARRVQAERELYTAAPAKTQRTYRPHIGFQLKPTRAATDIIK